MTPKGVSEHRRSIGQLPLLVVPVTVQQRSKYLSGWQKSDEAGNFFLLSKWVPRFQLVRRMTSFGDLVKRSRQKRRCYGIWDTVEPPTHFFKCSWPEDLRTKEGGIITEAVNRVRQHLPDDYHDFVLGPLPGSQHMYCYHPHPTRSTHARIQDPIPSVLGTSSLTLKS